MGILQQKKMYESQREQLAQRTFSMESVALAAENVQSTMAIVAAIKDVNKKMPNADAIEVGRRSHSDK